MNFQYKHNLATNLKTVEEEINKYSELTQTEIFNQSINRLLKRTLHKYNNNIDQLSGYLLNQEGIRILKAITKIQKFDNKKVIKENMRRDANDQHSE